MVLSTAHLFAGMNDLATLLAPTLSKIEETHPGATESLKLAAISVARSFIPTNRCAVDKTKYRITH